MLDPAQETIYKNKQTWIQDLLLLAEKRLAGEPAFKLLDREILLAIPEEVEAVSPWFGQFTNLWQMILYRSKAHHPVAIDGLVISICCAAGFTAVGSLWELTEDLKHVVAKILLMTTGGSAVFWGSAYVEREVYKVKTALGYSLFRGYPLVPELDLVGPKVSYDVLEQPQRLIANLDASRISLSNYKTLKMTAAVLSGIGLALVTTMEILALVASMGVGVVVQRCLLVGLALFFSPSVACFRLQQMIEPQTVAYQEGAKHAGVFCCIASLSLIAMIGLGLSYFHVAKKVCDLFDKVHHMRTIMSLISGITLLPSLILVSQLQFQKSMKLITGLSSQPMFEHLSGWEMTALALHCLSEGLFFGLGLHAILIQAFPDYSKTAIISSFVIVVCKAVLEALTDICIMHENGEHHSHGHGHGHGHGQEVYTDLEAAPTQSLIAYAQFMQ